MATTPAQRYMPEPGPPPSNEPDERRSSAECLRKYADFKYELDLIRRLAMVEEEATLESQFFNFAIFLGHKQVGDTISLWRSDYWLRQAKILEDRKLTMTETGDLWFQKFTKTEIVWDEWLEYLSELCDSKGLDEEEVKVVLTNCGMPGQAAVTVPQYRDYFDTFTKKDKMLF